MVRGSVPPRTAVTARDITIKAIKLKGAESTYPPLMLNPTVVTAEKGMIMVRVR